MQRPGPLPGDGQQLAVGFHLLDLPGEFGVAVDDQRAPLGVADQSLLPLAEHPHQGDHVFAGQVELGNGGRVGDGVAVDSQMAEGFAHALLLDEGGEDLFVAVDDVLHAGGWKTTKKVILFFKKRVFLVSKQLKG